jgi:tagatose 6-phosphate kinase
MVFPRLTLDAVNRAAKTVDGEAGKAVNVAKVLQALGERPLLAGFFGGDRGEAMKTALGARGIEMEVTPVSARTRQCITVIDESAGTQTELVEESGAVSAGDYETFLQRVAERVKNCRAVVMSGTLTPGGPPDFYARCLRLAHEAGALTVVDAQGPALTEALSAGPGLVKPNRSELSATLGHDLRDEKALISAMREMQGRGAQRVVVTAGSEPTLAFDGVQFWRARAPKITALNPIGSGDAFTAGLVWRLLRGDDLGEACRWAVAAGAANALTLMAGEVDRKEVERLAAEVSVERFG